MAEQNFYEILGIAKDASDDEIKTAYKKLARKYHPDLNQGNAEAADMFKKINEANETLSNSQKRREYDMELAGGIPGMGGMGMGGGSMFEDLFTNVFNAFTGGARPTAQQRVQSIVSEVTVSFIESLKGCSKKVPVQKWDTCAACRGVGAKPGTPSGPCPKCHGQGRIQYHQQTPLGVSVVTSVCDKCGGTGKLIVDKCSKCGGRGIVKVSTTIDINIPKGVSNGEVFTLKGMGNATNQPNVAKGDLVIKIHVEPHKYIKRQNNDLSMEFPIPLSTAIMGGKVEIPTADGVLPVDIPEGTSNGKIIKVKGKGVINKNGEGDLYIKFLIDIPKLGKAAKEYAASMFSEVQPDDYKIVKQFNHDMADLMK